MSSVTSRIKQIKQPYGGYIKTSKFIKEEYNDGLELKVENVHPSIVGLTVDYLSRFINGSTKVEAFIISLKGYELSKGHIDNNVNAFDLLDKINGLDNDSIINAAKLVTFDVWYRNRLNAVNASKANDINPDIDTINNIRIMVNRVVTFMKNVGPITQDGFTLEGGYTKTVTAGDGDYLTNDTIWDIKVSKNKITTEHTLQLAMYYLMAKHSKRVEFDNVHKIGIYNPRLNTSYVCDMNDISLDIIKQIEDEVICYEIND